MFPTVLYLQTRISFQQPKAEFFINFDLANRGGGGEIRHTNEHWQKKKQKNIQTSKLKFG